MLPGSAFRALIIDFTVALITIHRDVLDVISMSVADVILDLLFSTVLSVVCLVASRSVSRLDSDAVLSRFLYASFFELIVYPYKV